MTYQHQYSDGTPIDLPLGKVVLLTAIRESAASRE